MPLGEHGVSDKLSCVATATFFTRRGRGLYDQMELLVNWSFRKIVEQPLHRYKSNHVWGICTRGVRDFSDVNLLSKRRSEVVRSKGVRELEMCRHK